MTQDALYLGFDVGTQGTKGLVIDAASRRVLARASASYDLIEGLPPGAAEQHPDTWIDAVRTVQSTVMAPSSALRNSVRQGRGNITIHFA